MSESAALFDRGAWRAHRARAARGGSVDFLHEEVAERLIDRLDLVNRQFSRVLDLGARGGGLTRALSRRRGVAWVVAAEPAVGFLRHLGSVASAKAGVQGDHAAPALGSRSRGNDGSTLHGVVADPELLPFADASFDLVVSNLVLHWAGDLPGVLVQLRRALKPDGLLLAAMLGGQTLIELRTALFEAELAEEGGVSPRVSPAVTLADVAALLQRAGFALPVADSETITVSYRDMLALLRDLRGMGEQNALAARRRAPLRRATLAHAAELYAARFGDADGRVAATFEVLFLCGWAPAPEQPQPLPRGSARMRLADALKPPD